MKVITTVEIPDVFKGKESIDSLPNLTDFYGYAIEVEDNDGDTGVLVFIPSTVLSDVLAGDND